MKSDIEINSEYLLFTEKSVKFFKMFLKAERTIFIILMRSQNVFGTLVSSHSALKSPNGKQYFYKWKERASLKAIFQKYPINRKWETIWTGQRRNDQ